MLDKPERSVGNLMARPKNTDASKAYLRRPGNADGLLRSQFMGSGGKDALKNSQFEAVMAANQSQNKIIEDVLDGPVSQQTQRQLARIKAINQNHPVIEEIAENAKISPDQAISEEEEPGSVPLPRSRVWNLSGGKTIAKGKGTGSIFNPSQMTAYRQKLGISARNPDDPPVAAVRGAGGEAAGSAKNASRKDRTAKDLGKELLLGEDFQSSDLDGSGKDKISSIIQKAADALGLDPALVRAVIKTESNFNSKAVSRAGAKGLMQLMPLTAKEMGVKDPFDPLENIWGGARYLKRMLDKNGGNLNKALAAYNWGPGNLEKYGSGGQLPKETRRYIEVVNKNYKKYKNESLEA
jgi:SLT domain-containing protein